MTKVTDMFGLGYGGVYTKPDFLAGIECEIESFREVISTTFPNGTFKMEEDGSLRNHGVEFISIPMNKHSLLTQFNNLHASIRLGPEPFSSRTSTHVHVNCAFMEEQQVVNMTMLYALFEEFFFLMVDPIRRGNIHCVPLTETFLPQHYKLPLGPMVERWHKYTAYNLLPLARQGTVEFRHLQGTSDVLLLERWLTVLENLQKEAMTTEVTPEFLMSDTAIFQAWERIFAPSPRVMVMRGLVPSMISNTLLDVKLAFN